MYMRILDTYIGISPFTVEIDDSTELRSLAQKAGELRSLPFSEKLEAVKVLAINAMSNAYEGMLTDPDPRERVRYRDIVLKTHPLSVALEQNAGCCRYQGALFFVLGYEADLGARHFLQTAPVNPSLNTVFNQVIEDEKAYTISVFTESLKDKSLDYSRQNPRVFDQAVKHLFGVDFYSYHRNKDGKLILVSNSSTHVTQL